MATWLHERRQPLPVSAKPQVSVSSSAPPAQLMDRSRGVLVLGCLCVSVYLCLCVLEDAIDDDCDGVCRVCLCLYVSGSASLSVSVSLPECRVCLCVCVSMCALAAPD